MAGYLIVQVEVTDPDTFEEYKKQVAPTTEKYGGEYVVRGGEMEVLEGECPYPRMVVLRFPSVADAKAWYTSPEYEGPMAIRKSASNANVILVEGA